MSRVSPPYPDLSAPASIATEMWVVLRWPEMIWRYMGWIRGIAPGMWAMLRAPGMDLALQNSPPTRTT